MFYQLKIHIFIFSAFLSPRNRYAFESLILLGHSKWIELFLLHAEYSLSETKWDVLYSILRFTRVERESVKYIENKGSSLAITHVFWMNEFERIIVVYTLSAKWMFIHEKKAIFNSRAVYKISFHLYVNLNNK